MPRKPLQTVHAATQLWQLMDEVANATTEDEIYATALATLQITLGVERAGVMLLNSDGTLRSVAHTGLSEKHRAAVQSLMPSKRDQIFAPILISDVERDPRVEQHRELLRCEGIAAIAEIPLYFASNVLGRFSLYYPEPHEFDEREIAIARALASHVAFALEHRRMHGEVVRANAELAQKLAREREAKLRVRESESRLRLALDAGHMGTWDWNVRTGEVIWSPELQLIHGLEPGTFDGTFEAFKSDIHPEDLDRVLHRIRETLAGDEDDYCVEYRLVTPAGETRWIEARGRLLRDENDDPVRLIGICSNTTDRKRREEAQKFLQEASSVLATSLIAEETLANIANVAVPRVADWCTIHLETDEGEIVPVATAHSDPQKTAVARRAQARWQVDRESERGVAEVLRTGRPVLIPEITPEALAGAAQDDEHRALLESLELRSIMIVPLRTGSRIIGSLALISSDSARIYTEEDLVFAQQLADRAALAVENSRLYSQAKRAVKAREETIAVVSHDLRNPINTIVTACAVQELPVPPEKKQRAMASIQRAAKTMESLIQNLLDVARIDAGKLTVEREPLHIGALAEEACSLFAPLAEHASIRLEYSIAGELPVIEADRERLLQVMSNLLGNALKFVDEGGYIGVHVQRLGDEIEITVADSGTGISPDQIPHLFDRFWQGNPEGRNGTGLGLAIVKGIVDAHDGRIEVESIFGDGSTFRVVLPTRSRE